MLEHYVQSLATALAAKGYQNDLLVMNGNGGIVPASHVSAEAVKTVMSGPASGIMAAMAAGWRAALPNFITYDMGGGSVARVDGGGMLCVGPQWGECVPRPICHGKGEVEPTI